MIWNGYVVLKVPVQNLNDEEMDELNRDALSFVVDYDLVEEATVEFGRTGGGS